RKRMPKIKKDDTVNNNTVKSRKTMPKIRKDNYIKMNEGLIYIQPNGEKYAEIDNKVYHITPGSIKVEVDKMIISLVGDMDTMLMTNILPQSNSSFKKHRSILELTGNGPLNKLIKFSGLDIFDNLHEIAKKQLKGLTDSNIINEEEYKNLKEKYKINGKEKKEKDENEEAGEAGENEENGEEKKEENTSILDTLECGITKIKNVMSEKKLQLEQKEEEKSRHVKDLNSLQLKLKPIAKPESNNINKLSDEKNRIVKEINLKKRNIEELKKLCSEKIENNYNIIKEKYEKELKKLNNERDIIMSQMTNYIEIDINKVNKIQNDIIEIEKDINNLINEK